MDGLNTLVTENEDNSLSIHFSTTFTNYITEVAGKTGWNSSDDFPVPACNKHGESGRIQ